jgi:hypothetical protein
MIKFLKLIKSHFIGKTKYFLISFWAFSADRRLHHTEIFLHTDLIKFALSTWNSHLTFDSYPSHCKAIPFPLAPQQSKNCGPIRTPFWISTDPPLDALMPAYKSLDLSMSSLLSRICQGLIESLHAERCKELGFCFLGTIVSFPKISQSRFLPL